MKSKKIVNDPVYGFIRIPSELVFKIIEHPYFQRLRYIKQLGMTHLVYPGSLHTRFHHTLGAMHLMQLTMETLKNKGLEISEEEEEGVILAILLHDIGHGPFSHALEHTIVEGIVHEDISKLFMKELNRTFDNQLGLALQIFNNQYHKKFLYQLVSSQLDLDRLDYLNRDSFFTGVAEGVVGFDRIITMMNVVNDELVIEEKGIYSVEKFLIARRLMYWQVYFHKTVIASEQMLVKILKRAKYLSQQGVSLFATPCFAHFLQNKISKDDFEQNPIHLANFSKLDDNDIFASVKVWAEHEDPILAHLCRSLIHRKLYHTEISTHSFDNELEHIRKKVRAVFPFVKEGEEDYFVFSQSIQNSAYSSDNSSIKIWRKNGSVVDIAEASDNASLNPLAQKVRKYFICHDKNL